MNKTPKLWELLAAFLPIVAGITIWLWNLGTKVEKNTTKIEYLEKFNEDTKSDLKQIKSTMEIILIKLENKENRKP